MLYPLRNRNFWIMIFGDAFLLAASYFLAYYLRFDGHIPPDSLANFRKTVIWIIPLKLVCFYFFGLYKGMWRYTSILDLENLIKACITSSILIILVLLLTVRFVGFPRSIFPIDFFLTFLFLGGYRIGVRLYYRPVDTNASILFLRKNHANLKRLLIIGAGTAGEMLLREIRGNANLRYDVAGFIDDDPYKLKKTIHGVPVLGGRGDMARVAKDAGVNEIIIAVPSASAAEMRRILEVCKSTGSHYKTVPGMGEIIDGKVTVSAVREVRYEDLIYREQSELSMDEIGDYLTGKVVMIPGGVGSIGLELCRQIAQFRPELLVMVDKNESGLYDTKIDLEGQFPYLRIETVLGLVQNKTLMERVFGEHKPQVIFHAAAYKHVSMMESHPWEAVLNNIVGTQNILDICVENGVDRFVFVSTDKAVRPSSVMGASKRVCEILGVYASYYVTNSEK